MDAWRTFHTLDVNKVSDAVAKVAENIQTKAKADTAMASTSMAQNPFAMRIPGGKGGKDTYGGGFPSKGGKAQQDGSGGLPGYGKGGGKPWGKDQGKDHGKGAGYGKGQPSKAKAAKTAKNRKVKEEK